MKTKKNKIENVLDPKDELSIIYDKAAEGIIFLDDRGYVLRVNKWFIKTLGYSRDEIEGKHIRKMRKAFSKESFTEALKTFKQLTHKKVVAFSEIHAKKKDGTPLILDAKGAKFQKKNLSGIIAIVRDITDEYTAKKKLQESKNKYQILTNASPNGIIIHSNNKIVFTNNTALKIIGAQSQKQVLGKSPLDFLHPDYKKIVLERLKTLFSAKEVKTIEEKFIRLDGKIIDVEVSGRLIEFEGKKASQVVFKDITKRKKAEEELKQSKEGAEQYLNIIRGIVVALDGNGTITLINNSGAHMLGYTQKQLLGKNWFDTCIPKENRKTIKHVHKTIIAKKATLFKKHENEVLEKGGGRKTISWNNSLVKDSKGAIIGTLSSGQDITSQRKTENELIKNEEKFRTIFNSANDAIAIYSLKGSFIEVNEVMCTRLGYTREELLQTTPQTIESSEDITVNRKRISDLKQSGHIVFETEHITKSGKSIPVEINAKTIDYKGVKVILSSARDITERKESEKQLKESEEKYRTLSDSILDGILITSFTGKVLYCNKTVIDMFDFDSVDDVIGKNVLRYITRRHRKNVMRDFFYVSQGKEGYIAEYEVKNNKGKKFWIESLGRKTLYNNKSASLTVIRDITEKKQNRDKIVSSEERLRILFEYAPDTYFITDLKGKFIDGNKASEKLTGYKTEELIGKKFSNANIIPSKEIPILLGIIAKNAKGKPSGPHKLTLIKKNGLQTTIEISTHPVTIQGEKVILGIARDIGKRLETESELRKSEQQYKELFEGSIDGVVQTDLEGNITEFNEQFRKMLGYSERELLEKNYQSFTPKKWLEWEQESIVENQINKKGYSDVYEKEYIKKDGSVFPVELRSYLIKDESGKAIGMWGIAHDITERKRAESLLKTQRDISIASGSAKTLHEALTKILHIILTLKEIDSGGFYLVNKDGGLDLLCHKGLSKQFVDLSKRYAADSPNTKLIMEGKPIYTEYATIPMQIKKVKEGEKLLSIAILPIKEDGHITAGLNLASHQYKTLSSETRHYLESITSLIGSLISRFEAEKSLALAQEQYGELVNNLTIGVYRNTAGPKGHFLEANPAIISMFEAKSKEEFLKHTVSDLYVDPKKREEFSEKMLKRGFLKNEELELKTLKNRKFIGSVTAVMKKDSNGTVYFDGIVDDITERAKARKEIEQANKELAKKNNDLKKINTFMVGRELKMSELKKRIKELEQEVDNPSF
ncbi:PAS domain S-box protein [Patescibacteria group bacterium]|nr:PAS domain S-box protein [Patescibacteria group bacterium]